MRRCLIGLLLLAALGVLPAGAAAAPVLVLGGSGHAVVRDDPYLTNTELTPAPGGATLATVKGARAVAAAKPRAVRAIVAAKSAKRPAPRPPQATVRSELARLYRAKAISLAAYRSDNASFTAALNAVKHLSGTRATELQAVVNNLHQMAVAKMLTPSRLPAVFLTLDRNRQWWTTGPLLAPDQRIEFSGSQLVWEYYPGQGIELQELGNFGKADGLFAAGPTQYPGGQALLSELIPLAANRAGGVAWEYYFNFDGGSPPWTSAMSQATALEALSRAFAATHNPSYLAVASTALPVFGVAPPLGVRVPTARGARYLLYSFAPGAAVMNGFLQTLIGLYDYAQTSGSSTASALFAAGDVEARAELPSYDTGAWSLYQPGEESPLSYHELVTGFLQELCTKTAVPVYCMTAQHFQADLTTPPALSLSTWTARRGQPTSIRFWLSKASHVGIVVARAGATVFQTSASFAYGTHAFAIPSPGHTGPYSITLAATDVAGNFNRIIGTVTVRPH